jgi:drug/metabolite transporter (DMT)-like permease
MTWVERAAFVLLCGLIASEWLLPVESARKVSVLQQQGLVYGVIGIGALAFCWKSKSLRWVRLWRLALASALFFSAPAILLDSVNGWIASTSVSALFAMTPVVVMLTVASGAGRLMDDGDPQRVFVPALIGLGGVLCVVPFDLPASQREWSGLGVVLIAVVIVGVAGVWLYLLFRNVRWLEGIAVAGVCNALVLLAWCVVRGDLVFTVSALREEISFGFVARVAETFLLLWLLRTMDPIRLSSRYLVIPLVTIVEGVVLLRPSVTVRLVIGVVLLVAGASWMLAARAREEEPELSLS